MFEHCHIEETAEGKFVVVVTTRSGPFDSQDEAEEVASLIDEDLNEDLFGETS